MPTKERLLPACLFANFVCAYAHMLTQGHATTHPWMSGHNLSKLVLSSHGMGHKDGTQVVRLAAKCLYPWTDLLPKCTNNEMHTLGLGLGRGETQDPVACSCNWGLHEEHYVFNSRGSLKSEVCISLGHCRLPIIWMDLSDVSDSTPVWDVGCQGVGWAGSCIIYATINGSIH